MKRTPIFSPQRGSPAKRISSLRPSPLSLLGACALLIFGTLALMALAFPAPPQHVLDAPDLVAYRNQP